MRLGQHGVKVKIFEVCNLGEIVNFNMRVD